MDEKISEGVEKFIETHFDRKDINQIKELIGRFCFSAQIYLVEFLIRAKEKRYLSGKPDPKLNEAIDLLDDYWYEHWKDDAYKGDPYVNESRNMKLIDRMYKELGIISPLHY